MWFRRQKNSVQQDKAQAALDDAHENLKRTQDRACEVREVSKALKVMRERNHFAEQLQVIMEGPQWQMPPKSSS